MEKYFAVNKPISGYGAYKGAVKNPVSYTMFICTHKVFENNWPNNKNLVFLSSCGEYKNGTNKVIDISQDEFVKTHKVCWGEGANLYYLWKHPELITTDYVGLCHYRRYFNFLFNNKCDNIVSKIFEKNDVIVPTKILMHPNTNGYQCFCNDHNKKIIDIADKIINEDFPFYTKGWNQMKHSEFNYHFNIFLMPKKHFNRYCRFVFGVLEKVSDIIGAHDDTDTPLFVEKEIENKGYNFNEGWSMEKYKKWQNRLHGFLLERLTCTFLYTKYNQEKRFEAPLMLMGPRKSNEDSTIIKGYEKGETI